jgi:hypothetical protein
MTTLPFGRRFVLAYAILMALFNLSVLLPGNPVSSNGEFIVAVGVQALVVWRLWHGSSLSWLLAMFFAAGYVVTIVLMQPTLEVGVILTFVLSVAQVLILWMYALIRKRPLSGSAGIPPQPLDSWHRSPNDPRLGSQRHGVRICPGPLIARACFGRGEHLHKTELCGGEAWLAPSAPRGMGRSGASSSSQRRSFTGPLRLTIEGRRR